jgi:hypothetical protein
VVLLLPVSSIRPLLRRFATRISILAASAAIVARARGLFRPRVDAEGRSGALRGALPSLFERHPEATRAPRRSIGIQSVPLDAIVGTMRHPSQNTADFLPLPRLRGENWRGRWQRIGRAMDRLDTLPPVDLVQVGDDYYVADGHNRVAAARQVGALEIDADVTQLLIPGVTRPEHTSFDAGSLYGADEVRQAAEGRHSRTVEQRPVGDRLSRQDLLRVRPEDQE